MDETIEKVQEFFHGYAAALLARDEKRIARLYAVPGLIIFPGQVIAVSDPAQTEQFFAGSWAQYEGVESAEPTIALMGAGPGSVWTDVSWRYDGAVRERFCYQLIDGASGNGYQIAVLTPLA